MKRILLRLICQIEKFMASNILPKIVLKNSSEAEVGLFLKFLHQDFHKQQKNIILNSFSYLKEELGDNKEKIPEKDIVKKFVLNFYEQNADKITSIIDKDAHLLAQKEGDIVNALGDLMDADWSKRPIFYAIPTILPFSPFEESKFYYSILGRIRNSRTPRSVIFIAAHEISHFIFYDILQKISNSNQDMTLSKESEHFLKEALASAVLNEKPLKKILELDNYSGNPELKDLYLKIDGKIIGFTDFITNYYHKCKIENKEPFRDVLCGLIKIVSSIDSALIIKKELWNRDGMSAERDPESANEYATPIIVNI